MRRRSFVTAAAAAAALTLTQPAVAQQRTIEMWIGLTGLAQELLVGLGNEFNTRNPNSEFRVNVSFRGQYPEQRAAAIAAFRAGNPPHIMQMFDAGTGDMMSARSAVIPVSDVYRRAGLQFDPSAFIGPAAGYYSLPDGTMLSQPMNVSTAVMFYNKDAFRRAGLNPDQPPATWPDLIDASRKMRAAGMACGFTSTWIAWIMLEQFSAIHDVPLSTLDNGRGGLGAVLNFNDAARERMVQTLIDLQKDKTFDYGGRSNNAEPKFISGECGIMLQSSGGRGTIARDARFEWGMAPLPHWPDLVAQPKNGIVGGASLWVFNAPNRSDAELRVVAQFLDFLRSPDVLQRFAEPTGFVPPTLASYSRMKESGYFEKNPGTEVPFQQLTRGTPTANSLGYRFGRWTEIRDFYHEEVERALQGQITAKQALDNAVQRGNVALRQFERTAQ